MTVKELIELNQMILDIVIEVRQDGGVLLDKISIGNDVGDKPPYPTRVPVKPEYAHSLNKYVDGYYKDATYIRKSINTREDGKEYWQTKWKCVPAKYLELEVFSWEVWRAHRGSIWSNKYNEGERINIVALPSGNIRKEKPKLQPNLIHEENWDMQMTLEEWLGGKNHNEDTD